MELDTTSFLASDAMVMLSGIAVFVVVWLFWQAFGAADVSEKRLKSVVERREDLRAAMRAKSSPREGLITGAQLKQWGKLLKSSPWLYSVELKKNLIRAGIRGRQAPAGFALAKIGLPLGFFLLGLLLVSVFGLQGGLMKLALLLGLPVFGFLLPDMALKNMIQKREEVLRRSLPDAFDLLVICAEAGLGLDAALDRVAKETASSLPVLAEEIGLTAVELGFLPDRRLALLGLTERVQLPAVRALINTLVQSEKYGTPLAQALRVLSTELRDERMMKAEEKAAKLPATLTVPMILFILPTLFIVLLGPAIIQVFDLNKG